VGGRGAPKASEASMRLAQTAVDKLQNPKSPKKYQEKCNKNVDFINLNVYNIHKCTYSGTMVGLSRILQEDFVFCQFMAYAAETLYLHCKNYISQKQIGEYAADYLYGTIKDTIKHNKAA